MNYSCVESSLQGLFAQHLPLSAAQSRQVAHICTGVLLAGSCQLRRIARWLDDATQQDSRVCWIRRLLDAPFVSQSHVYQPWVKHALQGIRDQTWHLLLDRTALDGTVTDLLTVSLAYRKRAIPLAWRLMPYGRTSSAAHLDLVQTCLGLIPPPVRVILHGDSEFGQVPLMRFVRQHAWHFILGQPGGTCYRLHPAAAWQRLDSLPVTPSRAIYLSAIQLTKEHQYGDLNLFAFYAPYRNRPTHAKQLIRYCATSLPIAHTLRQIGRRRWGTECFYQDYKSSGWQMTFSGLKQPQRLHTLLVILALSYLWATCMGRWLCKTGQRDLIDRSSPRQLSFFRLGWDYLVNQERCRREVPHLLTLYS